MYEIILYENKNYYGNGNSPFMAVLMYSLLISDTLGVMVDGLLLI